MGKVLSAFENGSLGAVSRSVDDIIIALANRSGEEMEFGTPVALSSDGAGAVKLGSAHASEDFVGFTARSASKTPDAYGESTGKYNPGEMMDVLTRGGIVVSVAGSPAPGDKVYMIKASGKLTPTANADTTMELTNVRFRGPKDSQNLAEVVVLSRNRQ